VSFFPIDRDILTSSIWVQGTPEQIKVWFYLMLTAHRTNGVVTDTIPAIAQRCALSIKVTQEAIHFFAQPDRFSRTKDREGRKIELTPEGHIRLINYEKHRDKDYSTPRVQKWRERKKNAETEMKRDVTLRNDENVTETTDIDKDTDKDTDRDLAKKQQSVPETLECDYSNSNAVPPPSDKPEVIAIRYLAAINAVQGRRIHKVTPDVMRLLKLRLKDWKPWEIEAAPILAWAQGKSGPKKKHAPAVYLRDGEHGKTRNGNTYGAYYWLSAIYTDADGTELDERLSAIVKQLSLFGRMVSSGVRVTD